MNIHQMSRLCPTATLVGTGVLQNWSMGFYKTCDSDMAYVYADVRESEDNFANVAVWEVINPSELEMLDRFEGYPSLYKKLNNCKVVMGNGETIEGFLYKMSNNAENGIPDVYYFMGIYQAYKDLHISTKQLDDFLENLSRLREVQEMEDILGREVHDGSMCVCMTPNKYSRMNIGVVIGTFIYVLKENNKS